MARVLLGNHAAIETYRDDDDELAHRPVDGGPRVTTYAPPDEWPLAEQFATLTARNGAWEHHSADPPAWVECDDRPTLAALIADHYGCPVGRPDDWDGIE